jgi:general secretion pathway protein K
VVALPQATPVNINTADAVVLSATAENLSLGDGESLLEARPEEGYEDVDKFTQESTLKGKQIDRGQLSVQSQWFLLLSEANIGQGRARLASVLQRQRDEVRVVGRQREFSDPVVAPIQDEEQTP